MKVLIVRTSSLGDLVHMLPAISDIARHHPGVTLDWVVEEAFAEIPAWHPAVNDVIPIAHRRWRRNWWAPETRAARKAVVQRIRAAEYDLVIDMQALLKSLWLGRVASGVHHGLDWKSAREPLCSLFYDKRHRVEFWQPAVIRQRTLAALSMGHAVEGEPDFGLGSRFVKHVPERPYAVIMPSASRDDKLWPEADWQAVFDRLQSRDLDLVLLAGSGPEAQRAEDLIKGRTGARVQPRSNLTQLADLMVSSDIMVGLDSGLTHLSAAVGVPTIGLYKASTPVRTPVTGSAMTFSLGDRGREPTRDEVLAAIDAIESASS